MTRRAAALAVVLLGLVEARAAESPPAAGGPPPPAVQIRDKALVELRVPFGDRSPELRARESSEALAHALEVPEADRIRMEPQPDGGRALITIGAGKLSSRLAHDPPALRAWGWSGLVSQAGLALGIAAKIQGQFPTFGNAFAALAVATVALNELVGPIVFKAALDRTGESARHEAAEPAPEPTSG